MNLWRSGEVLLLCLHVVLFMHECECDTSDSHWHIYPLTKKTKQKHPKYIVHRQEDVVMYKYNTARQE